MSDRTVHVHEPAVNGRQRVLDENDYGRRTGVGPRSGPPATRTIVIVAVLSTASAYLADPVFSQVARETLPEVAFLWAERPTAPEYTVDARYAFAADPGRVERRSAGRYRVHMEALRGGGGNVQVTAYGDAGGFCNVERWGVGNADVRCFDGGGTASDSRFSLAVFRGRSGDNSMAYVWGDRPGSARYTPAADYTFGVGAPLVVRRSVGRYEITLGAIVAEPGGNVQVTGYGAAAIHCKVEGWSAGKAFVGCYSAAGDRTDSSFSLVALRERHSADDLAFVWASAARPAEGGYEPQRSYAFNGGQPILVSHSGTGRYAVQLGRIANEPGGNVQVTAYGVGAEQCGVQSWGQGRVQVRCHAGGRPVDTRFSMLMLGESARDPDRAVGVSVPVAPPSLAPFGVDALDLDDVEPVLVILASFTDAPFGAPLGTAFYDDWFFGRGTSRENGARTVAGYYRENSWGRVTVQRAGLVPVRFPTTRACAFGTPECPGSAEDGLRYRTRAVALADQQAGFDFSRYDTDRDGRVTPDELAIVVIGADSDPRGSFGGQAGPKVPNCVAVGSGASATQVCGWLASFNQNASLMTMIHETSHLWGSKDLYGPGAGLNSALTTMAATGVSTPGVRKVWHFDPWHKMAFGWLRPRFYRTTDPGACVSLGAAQQAGFREDTSPVVLYDPVRGAEEYFILEFRKREVPGTILSADAEMADSQGGLAIWRVQPNAQGTLDGDFVRVSGSDTAKYARANHLGAPDARTGGSRLWRAEHGDIRLVWSDGTAWGTSTPVGVTIRVGPVSPTGGGVQVAWFRGDEPPAGPYDDLPTEACFRTVGAAHGG